MKIKLSTIIELNDGINDEHSLGIAIQNIFDNIVNFCTTRHLQEALNAMGRDYFPNEEMKKATISHHKQWAKICQDSEWQYEEIK